MKTKNSKKLTDLGRIAPGIETRYSQRVALGDGRQQRQVEKIVTQGPTREGVAVMSHREVA